MSTTVYNQLFKKILSGDLPAGSRLKEVALAEEFGVSRTPIREVLRELAADGLVHILPSQGARVSPFTADDVEEVYDIRKALELLVLECCIKRLTLSALSTLRERVASLEKDPCIEHHAELDRELHDYFIKSANRPRLAAVLNQQLRLMQQFRYLGFRDTEVIQLVSSEHLKLIDALFVRDLDLAKEILAHHIEASKVRVLFNLNSL